MFLRRAMTTYNNNRTLHACSRNQDRGGAGADGGTGGGQQGEAARGVAVRAGRLCRLGMLPQEAPARRTHRLVPSFLFLHANTHGNLP